MAEQSHIEDFFKKRLGSREFKYREEDWFKMERKLELTGFPPTNASHVTVKVIIIILAAATAAFFLGWLTSELIRHRKDPTGQNPSNTGTSYVHAETIPPNTGNPYSQHSGAARDKTGSLPLTSGTANARRAESTEVIVVPEVEISEVSEIFENSEISMDSEFEEPEARIELSETSNSSMISTKEKDVGQLTFSRSTDLHPLHRRNTMHEVHIPELNFSSLDASTSGLLLQRPMKRWSAGILIAPDFNSTGMFRHKTLSPVIGGIVTYDLTPRWSLALRILYNNKKYSSNADDYEVPYYYWQSRTNGEIPENIEGSCHVLDVPVLLSYRFYRKRTISLNASAGLGSYFILDENYEFSFSKNNPGADTYWYTDDNSEVWFGVANLALRLSLQTSPTTSFNIEPYFKIPLKQMGWGNVNLSGMGLSFSLLYHF